MKKYVILLIILSLQAITGCNTNINPQKTLATVNGDKITEQEVLDNAAASLQKIDIELYKIKRASLENIIDRKLIEQAAKEKGQTIIAFEEEYLKKNIQEPTEKEIKKYYEFRRKQIGDKKFEDVKESIKEFLISNRAQTAQKELISKLRQESKVAINLEQPRVDIEIGDSPVKGPIDAPITIVEFSDFQCPFSGKVQSTIAKVLEAYPNQIKFVYKDFPLDFHKLAPKAHEASYCAGEQGKYWQMRNMLFTNQKALNVKDIENYAKKLGLDKKAFDECLSNSKYASIIKQHIKEGKRIGVPETPTFYINGILISEARPFADFQEIIETELKKDRK